MLTHFRHAAIALVLVAGTGTAGAQVVITRDADAPVAYGQPLRLTPAQRTTIYRSIVPQRRGRAPIVHERIVTEPAAPTVDDYAYDDRYDYDYGPAPAVPGRADVYDRDDVYAVGDRVPSTVRLAPIPQAVVAEVPVVGSYRYLSINGRILLVDPVTGTVVADVTPY